MSSDAQRSITVRLEIDIPQGGDETKKVVILDATFNFTQPPISSGGPVTVNARKDISVGRWLICTQGSFPSGTPPRSVFAKSYPQGTTPDASPPPDAIGQTVGNSTWGTMAPLEVPVALPDGVSTLVLWADYGDHYTRLDPSRDFKINKIGITACGQGSLSGSGFESFTSSIPGTKIPTKLYAHLSSAHGLSGAYALVYDPNTKVWSSDGGAGSLGFHLSCHEKTWQLNVKGVKTYHPTVAQAGPSPPFQLVFKNVSLTAPDSTKTVKATVEILVSK